MTFDPLPVFVENHPKAATIKSRIIQNYQIIITWQVLPVMYTYDHKCTLQLQYDHFQYL